MDFFCNINVGDIGICTEKTEEADFYFENTSRFGDGFVCFTSGEGELVLSNEPPIKVKKGSFIRFSKGDCYEFHMSGPCSYITSELDTLTYSDTFPRVVECADNEISFLRRICERFEEKDRLCVVETRILLMRFLVGLDDKVYSAMKQVDHTINTAIEYIHQNYNRNFTVDELADYCHISASYLMQSFKNAKNISIMAYRETLRVKSAKEMLMSGAFRIKEIADLLGYCDVYHFTKRFKDSTGKTPAAYAKRLYE